MIEQGHGVVASTLRYFFNNVLCVFSLCYLTDAAESTDETKAEIRVKLKMFNKKAIRTNRLLKLDKELSRICISAVNMTSFRKRMKQPKNFQLYMVLLKNMHDFILDHHPVFAFTKAKSWMMKDIALGKRTVETILKDVEDDIKEMNKSRLIKVPCNNAKEKVMTMYNALYRVYGELSKMSKRITDIL